MESGSRRREQQILQSSRRWKDVQTSPERNRVWTEPAALVTRMKRVSVVYYLSRNGHLEHPHFMEVTPSCPDGLYLKDVVSRLNILRGKGMAIMYSWSSKRSYKNGFVWQDLSEDDYIHPVHGIEYVLKGSEILLVSDHQSEKNHIHEATKFEEESESPLIISSGRNQLWSSDRLHECKVYKTDSGREVNASTQTGEWRSGQDHRLVSETENENQIVEVEGSPPPVDSSPETLESLMKVDKQVTVITNSNTNEDMQSGRLKASSVLIQLITCGSFSFRDCGTTTTTTDDHHNGVSLIANQQHKAKMHVTGYEDEGSSHVENKEVEEYPSSERVSPEDKEYFSGSVIEKKTQMKEWPSLQRSSSYNADRASQTALELAEKQEMGSVSSVMRAKCISRMPKASFINTTTKTETHCDVVASDARP